MVVRLLTGAAILILVMALGGIGAVYASSRFDDEEKVGLFCTVSTMVDGSIVCGSRVISTDENTQFMVPSVDHPGLGDIDEDERLAIVGTPREDGSLLAMHIWVIPEEAVTNTHCLVAGAA